MPHRAVKEEYVGTIQKFKTYDTVRRSTVPPGMVWNYAIRVRVIIIGPFGCAGTPNATTFSLFAVGH